MAKMQGLWHPRPKIDEAEFDAARSRTAERLADLFGLEPTAPPTDPEATDREATPVTGDVVEAPAARPDVDHGPGAAGSSRRPDGSRPAIVVEGPTDLVGVMAEPGPALVGVIALPDAAGGAAVEIEGGESISAAAPGVASRPARPPSPAVGVMAPRRLKPGAKGGRSGVARTAVTRPVRPGERPARAKTRGAPVAIAPSCPYCAVLLQPAPTTSRRCVRCHHRIVVKRVAGRAVYLTEAAVLVFEAERKRNASAGRLARERARWLHLAVAAGAPAERANRLISAAISEAIVGGARMLYVSTVERSFQAAKRDHRWEDASRIRREHAAALYRIAGAPVPPPPEIVKLHREGAAAALRGIAEIARDAELVGSACCEACRADDGRILRISAELRAPRLPHDGCPKGLCRCGWALATPRTTVQRYLRRRPRAVPVDTAASLVTIA